MASQKYFAAICLSIVSIGIGVALTLEGESELEREQLRRDLALQALHDTDLRALYDQINLKSFGGRLPTNVSASWADLHSDPRCGNCGGMTDYDSGWPAIRINTATVRSEEGARELMQHEMCHVAVHDEATKAGQDPHGPLWQECMKRF